MCPADADRENDQLESLEMAIKYFQSKSIETIVIKPKYMGSRAQFYIHRDVDKSFATSRNGYAIPQSRINRQPLFKEINAEMKQSFWMEN